MSTMWPDCTKGLLNSSVKPLKSLYENEVWVDFVMIGMHEGELHVTKNSKVLPKNKINFNLTLLLQG